MSNRASIYRVIIGESGSGKSFGMQVSALRDAKSGTKTFVVVNNMGHEYRMLCKSTQGNFVKAVGENWHINVMDFSGKCEKPTPDMWDEGFFTLTIFIEAIIRRELTPQERKDLKDAVSRAYQGKEKECLTAAESKYVCPELADLAKAVHHYPNLKEIGDELSLLLENPNCTFFAGQTNIDLDSILTVFNLCDFHFKTKYFHAAWVVALDYIRKVAKNGLLKANVYLDDTGLLLDTNDIFGLYYNRFANEIRQQGYGLTIALDPFGFSDIPRPYKPIYQAQVFDIFITIPEKTSFLREITGMPLQDELLIEISKLSRGCYLRLYPDGFGKWDKLSDCVMYRLAP